MIVLPQPSADDRMVHEGSVIGLISEVSGTRVRVEWDSDGPRLNSWLERDEIFAVGVDEHFRGLWEIEPAISR